MGEIQRGLNVLLLHGRRAAISGSEIFLVSSDNVTNMSGKFQLLTVHPEIGIGIRWPRILSYSSKFLTEGIVQAELRTSGATIITNYASHGYSIFEYAGKR